MASFKDFPKGTSLSTETKTVLNAEAPNPSKRKP